jgi:pimeloyl-ACP methyl ester carboxylesterase
MRSVSEPTLVSERIGQFHVSSDRGRDRLEYTEYGSGEAWVVLLPALLTPRRMHDRLARRLAGEGFHVVTLDLLGHGRSDRPADPLAYSTDHWAEQVVALLDHVGAERAVVGGTSLGANVALMVAATAPERVCGLLLEMPVLHNGLQAGMMAFAPLLLTARHAPFAVTGVRLATGLVPRRLVPRWTGVVLDTLGQRPRPLAAYTHGLFFGRVAPLAPQRRAITVPTLVVGHAADPIHRLADAELVAAEIPDAALVQADSILEWRRRPDRLDDRAVVFVSGCWRQHSSIRRRTG